MLVVRYQNAPVGVGDGNPSGLLSPIPLPPQQPGPPGQLGELEREIRLAGPSLSPFFDWSAPL